MDDEQLRRDVRIDPGQLDVEAVRQAEVFFQWAERSVHAKGLCDDLEFRLEVLEANLQLSIREEPETFGLKNPTETAIKSAVKRIPDFIKLTETYNAARREQMLLDKAVVAMEQRKRMLEVLITLHGQEYFAGPSVPRDLVAAWQQHQSKAGAEVNDRQRQVARKRVVRCAGEGGVAR